MSHKIQLEIESLLNSLGGNATFRLSKGILHRKLTEAFLEAVDEVTGEMISVSDYEIYVSVSEYDGEFIINCRLDSDNIDQEQEIRLSDLDAAELSEVHSKINLLSAPISAVSSSQKNIIRKHSPDGMLNINHSASRLNCSQIHLKSKIPCTDYSYQEINGIKEIKEYYWSEDLIDRLCQIKENGVKTEDVQYVATECCHGDCKWAEEILNSLVPPISTQKDGRSAPQSLSKRNKNTDKRSHLSTLHKKSKR
jgi:hypothetical protein